MPGHYRKEKDIVFFLDTNQSLQLRVVGRVSFPFPSFFGLLIPAEMQKKLINIYLF